MLTEQEVREMRERDRKATPGPWEWQVAVNLCTDEEDETVWDELVGRGEGGARPDVLGAWAEHGSECGLSINDEDADFLAHSRMDVPRLLDDREELIAGYERIAAWARERAVCSVYLEGLADELEGELAAWGRTPKK